MALVVVGGISGHTMGRQIALIACLLHSATVCIITRGMRGGAGPTSLLLLLLVIRHLSFSALLLLDSLLRCEERLDLWLAQQTRS
jgi:hypothetical protein